MNEMEKQQKRNICGGCGGCLDCLRVERSMPQGVSLTDLYEEEKIELTLPQAAEQALWDLRQWVKDHAKGCECFTCGESIPDLENVLHPKPAVSGVCC